MNTTGPTALDDYLFDLRGYLVIEGAVAADELESLNAAFDRLPNLPPGGWVGNCQRRDYTPETGYELHNCIEFDPAFDRLIDHPSWIDHVRHWCGEEDSYVAGLFIDECIASIRRSGGHHPVHSGGYRGALRGMYHWKHGVFRCGQVNVLLALTDIGPTDGPTMVVPGSHKANFPHPLAGDYGHGDRMDDLPGAVSVPLRAGDALLFVDGLMHGGSSRTNPEGERRVTIFRYGPSWAATRFGYTASDTLLARLSPERRRILQPVPPVVPGDARFPQTAPYREG
ncbi:MAG: phytanoyl-CoA dioxygenase family protein [Armatimonadota bacterium]